LYERPATMHLLFYMCFYHFKDITLCTAIRKCFIIIFIKWFPSRKSACLSSGSLLCSGCSIEML